MNEEDLILRVYFRKNLMDPPRYLAVKSIDEAIESVEIFGNPPKLINQIIRIKDVRIDICIGTCVRFKCHYCLMILRLLS